MTPDIEKILAAAIQAPSGENAQPWRFVVRGLVVEQWNLPERDQSPYSWGQRASYMANGAALENLILASNALGYDAAVEYFPSVPDHIATIVLSKGNVQPDPLSSAITARISNRKSYRREPLKKEVEKFVLTAATSLEYGSLELTADPDEINRLAAVGSANEEIMLSNDMLHEFFFSHLSWTKEEDQKKKIGFYIKTLELPPPAEFIFRLIKHRGVMRALRWLHFPSLVGKQNASIYASSSAIGVIRGEGYEPIDFVKAGRALERAWLAATIQGLSFQPLTGILFLMLKVQAGDTADFSKKEVELIRASYATVEEIFGRTTPVLFMFRIGYASPPSAHAIRFPLGECVAVI